MRRKLCMYMAVFLCASLLFSSQGHASSTLVVDSAEVIEDTLFIKGATSAGDGQQVTLLIESPLGSIVYIDQGTSGTGGSFEFTYSLENENAGDYVAYLGGTGVLSREQVAFEYQGASNPTPAAEISVNPPSVVDNDVHITGTISTGVGQQVTLLITAPSGVLIHIDQTTSGANGAFEFVYGLNDPIVGTYGVSVGGTGVQERQKVTFEYEETGENPDPDPNPNPNPNPGQGQGNGNTPTIVKEETSDGRTKTRVVFDSDRLGNALGILKDKDKGAQTVTIEIDEESDIIEVELPAEALVEAAENTPDAIIEIKSSNANYNLPVSLLNLADLAAELENAAKDLKVKVTMEKVSGEIAEAIADQARANGIEMLGDAFDFSIVVEAGGKSKKVESFGKKYVSRSIVIAGELAASEATAVVFDPETDEMQFVPAVIETIEGKTHVHIKRNSNSIYTVVKSSKSFADMADHWAKSEVELLASKLIINGMSETAFAPEKSITRAQFAALVVRGLGLSKSSEASPFIDVAHTAWYSGDVNAALQAGIISGFGDGTFRPDEEVTREQMAVIIANAMQATSTSVQADISKLSAYKDQATISPWARGSMTQAVEAGIIKGVTVDTIEPTEQATRAEAAVMLKRFLGFVEFIN